MAVHTATHLSPDLNEFHDDVRPGPSDSLHEFGSQPEPIELPTRKLTPDEELLLERARREPVESAARLEEAAKLLLGIVAATAGSFFLVMTIVAAFAQASQQYVLASLASLPLWILSLTALCCVFLPRSYVVQGNSIEALRCDLSRGRRQRLMCLILGGICFLSAFAVSFWLMLR